MADLMKVPGNWLNTQLANLRAEAMKREAEISTTNGIIVAGNARAAKIKDPAKRKLVQDGYHKLAVRQGQIQRTWKTWWGNIDSISAKVQAWLVKNGYANTLGALGLLPVVLGIPLELFVLLTVGAGVWAVNEWIKNANKAAVIDAQTIAKAAEARIAGQISDREYRSIVEGIDQVAKAAPPPGSDLLGLGGALKAAGPVIALGGLLWAIATFAGKRRQTQRRAA